MIDTSIYNLWKLEQGSNSMTVANLNALPFNTFLLLKSVSSDLIQHFIYRDPGFGTVRCLIQVEGVSYDTCNLK